MSLPIPPPDPPQPCATLPDLGGAGFDVVEQPASPLTDSQLWGEEELDSAE
jgi:hypothetical protein